MLPDTLPPWMYHGQLPPPDHKFNDQIFGITWVDLVFPMFLFSMGAAIPLALHKRLEKGDSVLKCIGQILWRALLLAAFSLLVKHLSPGEWSKVHDAETFKICLLGFGLLILMFIRWPKPVPAWLGRVLALAAWVAVAWMIHHHHFRDDRDGFARDRIDVILVALANVAASGGIVWLLTRCRPLLRLGIATAVALIFLTQDDKGSLGKAIWDFTPVQLLGPIHDKIWFPIFYHFEYHKYLLIVLPGTFCGDLILNRRVKKEETTEAVAPSQPEAAPMAVDPSPKGLRESLERQHEEWQQEQEEPAEAPPEPPKKEPKKRADIPWGPFLAVPAALAAIPLACWGLFSREVLLTSGILLGLGVIIVIASWRDSFDMALSRFGFAYVFLGLLAEPIGGGIRKDSPTLSYFLLTAGLGFWLVLALERLCGLTFFRRLASPITMTGQNPILAYAAITGLVAPLVGLIGYSDYVARTRFGTDPWQLALADGGVRTAFLVLIAVIFTRMHLFLRA